MPRQTTDSPSRDAAKGDRNDKAPQQRQPTTRERIRKIIERHRETFDELAK